MIAGLPKSLTVNGRDEPIRYQYTAVLDAISAMNDPELTSEEKVYVSLYIIYENFERFEKDDLKDAFEKLIWFINNGIDDERKEQIKVVDFEQDYRLIISAVNRVAGKEVREDPDMHWWTFLSYFMEIGECTFSTVVSIRNKKKKGKKLEKWEQEFYAENKKMIDIQERLSAEEKDREKWLNSLLD